MEGSLLAKCVTSALLWHVARVLTRAQARTVSPRLGLGPCDQTCYLSHMFRLTLTYGPNSTASTRHVFRPGQVVQYTDTVRLPFTARVPLLPLTLCCILEGRVAYSTTTLRLPAGHCALNHVGHERIAERPTPTIAPLLLQNNQVNAIKETMALATLLGRTLALPDLHSHLSSDHTMRPIKYEVSKKACVHGSRICRRRGLCICMVNAFL